MIKNDKPMWLIAVAMMIIGFGTASAQSSNGSTNLTLKIDFNQKNECVVGEVFDEPLTIKSDDENKWKKGKDLPESESASSLYAYVTAEPFFRGYAKDSVCSELSSRDEKHWIFCKPSEQSWWAKLLCRMGWCNVNLECHFKCPEQVTMEQIQSYNSAKEKFANDTGNACKLKLLRVDE